MYELSDGRFQLIEQGPIVPFMDGYRYLLVEKPLAEYLQNLDVERIRIEPAVLFNRRTGDEIESHARVHVGDFFIPRDIRKLNMAGMKMLAMVDENRAEHTSLHYFVSPELMLALKAAEFDYLVFSEGLSSLAF